MRKVIVAVFLGLLLSSNAYADMPYILYKDENKIHIAHKMHLWDPITDMHKLAAQHCGSYGKYYFHIVTYHAKVPINLHYKDRMKNEYRKGAWATEFFCSKDLIKVAPPDAFSPGQEWQHTNFAQADSQDSNTTSKNKNVSTTSKVEITSMIDKAKSTCKSLGFKEGTEKFSDCSLKLYSQSVELAAEQNKTVVMQPQSSGSNTMTIYDPVRDSNALIKQGQRMLSGRCTLGIDC